MDDLVMCRFIAYLGIPLILSDLLIEPANSLIKQSVHARETEDPLNGDGFGIGWYEKTIDSIPALFKSIQPAWSDKNLNHLSRKIKSNCFFAHIRSASEGDVAYGNCHPFYYQQFLFMHNGTISGFKQIKRHLRRKLSDTFYDLIHGQTDSEHFFALFLYNFYKKNIEFNIEVVSETLIESIHEIEMLKKAYSIHDYSTINVVISNGESMVASRYISDIEKSALSLHYTIGQFEYSDNSYHVLPSQNNKNNIALITSECLNESKSEWEEIPVNHILMINSELQVSLKKIPLC